MPSDPEVTGGEQPRSAAGKFQKGISGNPAGRPKGSRNRALVALDAIGQQHAEALLRRVLAEAARGDMQAASLILARVWPAPKSRTVAVKLPKLRDAASTGAAIASVISAVSKGDLAPDEGSAVIGLLEAHARATAIADLEQRLAALEAEQGGAGGRP